MNVEKKGSVEKCWATSGKTRRTFAGQTFYWREKYLIETDPRFCILQKGWRTELGFC